STTTHTEEFPDHLHHLTNNIIFIDGLPHLDHGEGLVTPLNDDPYIPDVDAHHIPRTDIERVIVDAITRNRRLLLVGDAGSGKSSAIEQIAARIGYPCRRLNLNGETGVSEFVGQWIVKGQEMAYLYGVLPTAMRCGHLLVLDELDAAQPEVLFVLQAVLEGKPLLLTETGESVQPHRNFRLMATANAVGDDSGLYAGTRVQNAATMDRWDLILRVGYPKPAEESELVQRRTGVMADVANRLVTIFTDLREACTRGDLAGPFSTRRLVAFAETYRRYGDHQIALKLSVTDRLPATERVIVEEIVRRHLGADGSMAASAGSA
ncbi:MAG TPA: AAA family ATPase, partial [Gemmatimonadales bacterium]|nr:AAA family ATPase [Gemmatimonadales bacterium]